MQVTPYVHFNGRCEEVLKFYEKALGAKINYVYRYKDAPPNPSTGKTGVDPDKAEWIMHANLQIGESQLMAADGPGSGQHDGYALSLNPASAEEGQKLFDALQAGAGSEVVMPYAQTFWALRFGMVKDPYGVTWMINVPDPDFKG